MIEICKSNLIEALKKAEAEESDLKFLESIKWMVEKHFLLKTIHEEERKDQREREDQKELRGVM
jgi:hypothetical protein